MSGAGCGVTSIMLILLSVVTVVNSFKRADMKHELEIKESQLYRLQDNQESKFREGCTKMGGTIRVTQDDFNQLMMSCDMPVKP